MESMGTVGCAVNQALPQSPFSSPLTPTIRMERIGRAFFWPNASASSMRPTVPEPSSSAPLLMLSGRPGEIPR